MFMHAHAGHQAIITNEVHAWSAHAQSTRAHIMHAHAVHGTFFVKINKDLASASTGSKPIFQDI